MNLNNIDPILGLAMMSGVMYINPDDTAVIDHLIDNTVFDVLFIGPPDNIQNFYYSKTNVRFGTIAELADTSYISAVVVFDSFNDTTQHLLSQICADRGLKLVFVRNEDI